ncbi:unnamed protein product, partial [Leptidea sinapis]
MQLTKTFGAFTKSNHSTLCIYKPFLIAMFICGYNYRIFKFNFMFRILSYFYSIILLIIISYSTFMCCNVFTNISQLFSLLEFVSSVLVVMIYSSKLILFFNKLGSIDSILRINTRVYVSHRNSAIIVAILLWLMRISFTLLHCLSYNCYTRDKLILFLINILSSFALDVTRVWRYTLLKMIGHRIKLLRIRLEEMPEQNIFLYVTKMKGVTANKMKMGLSLYRNIADAPLQLLILTTIHLIHITFLIFAPCIVIERYSVEVDRIQFFLVHRLLDEKDSTIKEEVKEFLKYTERRPFQFKIWRCIPVNIILPLEIMYLSYSTII